jgi:hypothetical protein
VLLGATVDGAAVGPLLGATVDGAIVGLLLGATVLPHSQCTVLHS